MKNLGIAVAALTLAAGLACAQDAALIIATEDYNRIADVRRGDEAGDLGRFFGPSAVTLVEPNAESVRQGIADYEATLAGSDSQAIVLSGRFVHSNAETYFLPRDARASSLADVSATALPLSAVLAYLAEAPGQALLALATDDANGEFGSYLRFGIGDIDIPQGVTVLTGEPRQMARVMASLLRQPGSRIGSTAARGGVTVSGFLRSDQVLRELPPPETEAEREVQRPAPPTNRIADLLAWRNADRANTSEAYEQYIDTFPTGQFVTMAQGRLKALTDTPEARAERDEQRLDLNREQRREIQRALTLLGFNTRGIDGIFGRGTRAAIVAWQGRNGFDQTGFLNVEQIRQLDAQATRRSEQLEEEAEARRQAQQAADRAFWAETGAFGDAAGFRAYLERFPDGEFSERARLALEDIEREKRRATDARDRQLWDEARIQNTVQAYEDYLTIAPNGQFRDDAEARIAELRRQNSPELQEARRAEDALNLNQRTRQLVEQRLRRVGLDPGRVDGNFTDDTRRAIRRYQEARQLPQTGYLTEDVIVRLLADSVRSLFR